MNEYFKLTGINLQEGETCPIKKMCHNCVFFVENEEGTGSCTNEIVNEKGREKIIASLPEGFEIEELKLKPMKLKDPTKKCGQYSVAKEVVCNAIISLLS